jgi:hypothetical protein
MTAVGKLADFQALDPFFRITEEGAAGLTAIGEGGESSCWCCGRVTAEKALVRLGNPRPPRAW